MPVEKFCPDGVGPLTNEDGVLFHTEADRLPNGAAGSIAPREGAQSCDEEAECIFRYFMRRKFPGRGRFTCPHCHRRVLYNPKPPSWKNG